MGTVATRRQNIDRGRPPTRRDRPFESMVIAQPLDDLKREIDGKRVVVVGSAPLDAPLVILKNSYVIVVNGAISSVLDRFPQLWIVNARIKPLEQWSHQRRFLHLEMMRQAANRHVKTVAFLTRQDNAEHYTAAALKEQGTTYEKAVVISRTDRERLEWKTKIRTNAMKKDACSAGTFAAIVALWAGARHVQMEGFSFGLGYQYLPGYKMPLNARAHVQGDRIALREMCKIFPGRVTCKLLTQRDDS